MSVPALESGRVARHGGCRARRGAQSPNRRKPFPARVAVFSRRSRKSGPDGRAAHAPKRPGRARFEALERADRRTGTRSHRRRRSFTRRGRQGIRGAARVPWASSPNSCGCSVRDRNRFHRAGSFRLSRLGAPARARATEWGRPRRDRECDHASRSRAPIERRGFWPARDAEGNDLTAHVAALFVTFQPSGSDSASRGSRRVCAFSHTTRAFGFCRFGASACSADCCEIRKPGAYGQSVTPESKIGITSDQRFARWPIPRRGDEI